MEDFKELIENNKVVIAFLVCFALASLIINIISLVTGQFSGSTIKYLFFTMFFGMFFGFSDFFHNKELVKRLILTTLVMFLLIVIFTLLKINSANRLFIILFASLNSIFFASFFTILNFLMKLLGEKR